VFSVLILTKDEQLDLPGCLDSVSWSDDIWVFDSFSKDRTVEIARERGAQVVQRAFDTYAGQRNAALSTLPFRHEWIVIPDCDERWNEPLYREMLQRCATVEPDVDALRIRRRDFFLGTWLKHCQMVPWHVRVVRRGKASYRRAINEVPVVDGRVVDLQQPFDHFPFSKGLARWIDKHNVYSSMEAEIVARQADRKHASLQKALFAKDHDEKRVARKAIFYKLPARPLMRWLYMMFYLRGILDGYAGFAYATLQAAYEFFIVIKTRELEQRDAEGRTRG
jgi:glycosyltransferase involved in cell wall biosynthesis